MKKINKKLLLSFFLGFFLFLSFLVFSDKLFGFRDSGPKSWAEIINNYPYYILSSLGFALIMAVKEYFDTPNNDNSK